MTHLGEASGAELAQHDRLRRERVDRAEVDAHVIPCGEDAAADGAQRLAAVDRQVVIQLGACVEGVTTDRTRLHGRGHRRRQPCNRGTRGLRASAGRGAAPGPRQGPSRLKPDDVWMREEFWVERDWVFGQQQEGGGVSGWREAGSLEGGRRSL